MKIKLYNIFYSLLFLVFVFSNDIFSSFLVATGTTAESGMKQKGVAFLAVIVYGVMIYDIFTKRFKKKDLKIMGFLAIMLLLMYFTSLINTPRIDLFWSYLLVFGAQCIPGAYLGCKFARFYDKLEVDKFLPFFVIPISIIIGTLGMKAVMVGEIVGRDESSLTYQSVSYAMSYMYMSSAYYVFLSPAKIRCKKIFNILMIVNMMFTFVLCLMSGGRGAFLFIIFITIYLVYSMREEIAMHKKQFFLIAAALISVFVIAASYFDILHSAGFNRVSETLTEDDIREGLWKKSLEVFLSSPLWGYGIGSIWWTVGFYSHNLFTDLLAESGLIGLFLFTYILVESFLKLYRYSLRYPSGIFIMLIFLSGAFQLLFSGYWIGSFRTFLGCAFGYACYSLLIGDNMKQNKN